MPSYANVFLFERFDVHSLAWNVPEPNPVNQPQLQLVSVPLHTNERQLQVVVRPDESRSSQQATPAPAGTCDALHVVTDRSSPLSVTEPVTHRHPHFVAAQLADDDDEEAFASSAPTLQPMPSTAIISVVAIRREMMAFMVGRFTFQRAVRLTAS
jgi:hypothetical protein